MVNLFRRMPAEQGQLTAALLALLEHADRELLNGLLRKSGVGGQVAPGADLQVIFPASEEAPRAGTIAGPHLRIHLLTQAPNEPPTPVLSEGAPDETLVITPTGKAPAGAHGLSWEQVDRWLAAEAEQYEAESRTGFLIRQFRHFLGELGIEYFPGFTGEQLDRAPEAVTGLNRFYQDAARFFERIPPALPEGVAELRQSRAEDLLAGYCYRDYSGAPFGPTAFLRLAFSLPTRELQLSFWLAPGSNGHARLREALAEDPSFLAVLQELERDPLLWLWSTAGERKLPLAELQPADLPEADWGQYQAGVQRSMPFEDVAGEGLVQRVAERTEELLEALSPVVSALLH